MRETRHDLLSLTIVIKCLCFMSYFKILMQYDVVIYTCMEIKVIYERVIYDVLIQYNEI